MGKKWLVVGNSQFVYNTEPRITFRNIKSQMPWPFAIISELCNYKCNCSLPSLKEEKEGVYLLVRNRMKSFLSLS